MVRRMIARNNENKLIGFQVETDVAHNSGIGSADCEPVLTQIVPIDSATGSTAQQRIGDRVKPKSLKVKGMLAFDTDAMNTNQSIYVRVLILSQKNLKTGAAVLAGGVDTARLLRPGYAGADQISYTGTAQNVSEPINTDLFRVYYDKVIRLTAANVSSGAVETMPVSTARWSYTFKEGKLPASLTFDEGNGNWANNFAPFLAIGYSFADGTAPDTITTRLVSNVSSFFTFEDA